MPESGHNTNHPLDHLAQIFDRFEKSSELNSDPLSDPNNSEFNQPDVFNSDKAPPSLTPKQERFPILVMDNQLRVVWQNQPAATLLWHHSEAVDNRSAPVHIFDLLLGETFQRQVDTWRKWLSFFIGQALRMLSKDVISSHIKLQDKSRHDLLFKMLEKVDPRELFSDHLDHTSKAGGVVTYHVIVNDFREGRCFSFRPESSSERTQRPAMQRVEIEQHLEQMDQQNDPVQTVFFILAARLNNASILQAELLCEEFSRLSNSLVNRFIAITETYGGMFEQQAGGALLAYFLPKNQSDSPMPVIDCALEIKSQMNDISREWKIRKGWLHDIELNMAMHRADEFINLLPTQLGSTLLTHGRALSTCSRLCELASAGQIWSTKNLVSQLDSEEIKRLSFGIYRRDSHRQVLVGKSFSRLADLDELDLNPFKDNIHISELAATQIFDCQSQR
jgi:class 3 adenylate cyclase